MSQLTVHLWSGAGRHRQRLTVCLIWGDGAGVQGGQAAQVPRAEYVDGTVAERGHTPSVSTCVLFAHACEEML